MMQRSDRTSTSEWDLLRKQILQKAMNFEGELIFDFRELMTDARCAEVAGRLMWERIRHLEPEVLIGPGYGAAPLLTATAIAALRDGVGLRTLMIRDQRKGHNRRRWVEGARPRSGSRAVIIDDFLKMGSAIKLIDQALAADAIDVNVVGFSVFFDMWEPLGSRQISFARFPVLALYKRHDIGLSRDCHDARPPEMKGEAPPFQSRLAWWRQDLHQVSEHQFKSSPVIHDGACFVADNSSRVWRHDLKSGDIDWCYESVSRPAKGIVQLMQIHEEHLIFGCYDGTVTKLDIRDGRVAWRMKQDSSIHATPEVDLPNRRMFINTEQWNNGRPFGHLMAMDWDSGHVIWTHAHPYWPPATPAFDRESDVVISTCNDQSISCHRAADGRVLWKEVTRGLVRGRPLVHAGKVYASTERGSFHCLDLATGKEIWQKRFGWGLPHAFVRIVDGLVCVLEGSHYAIFFDADTGGLEWITSLRAPGLWCPVSYGKYEVILSRNGEIAILDTQRRLKVREDHLLGTYGQPPAVGEGHIALASSDSGLRVYEIDPYYSGH